MAVQNLAYFSGSSQYWIRIQSISQDSELQRDSTGWPSANIVFAATGRGDWRRWRVLNSVGILRLMCIWTFFLTASSAGALGIKAQRFRNPLLMQAPDYGLSSKCLLSPMVRPSSRPNPVWTASEAEKLMFSGARSNSFRICSMRNHFSFVLKKPVYAHGFYSWKKLHKRVAEHNGGEDSLMTPSLPAGVGNLTASGAQFGRCWKNGSARTMGQKKTSAPHFKQIIWSRYGHFAWGWWVAPPPMLF